MPGPETTLIIPAYNEGDRLEEGLGRLLEAAGDGAVDLERCELLFVDDGSSDDTAAVAESLARGLPSARLLRQSRNLGKGAAVRAGVRAARGRQLVFTDADVSIDPHQLPALLAALHSPAEASPALQRVKTQLGAGQVRSVSGDEIRAARAIEPALA